MTQRVDRVRRLAGASVMLVALAARADPRPEPTWSLQVGHAYSSVSALRQPATFVLSADLGRPTLTKLDAGFLVQGPWAANGGFDVQKGVLAVEATPLGGLPGLGVWARPSFRLRWRPWIGLGYGNVFETVDARELESGAFWRGLARLELHFTPGRSRPGGVERAHDEAQFDLEATGWLLFDAARGEGDVKAALAVPLGSGLSLAASAEAGRQPPRFELERRIGIGLGFAH